MSGPELPEGGELHPIDLGHGHLSAEASNLEIHVEMCARRHAIVMDYLQRLDKVHATKMEAMAMENTRRLARIEKAAWSVLTTVITISAAGLSHFLPGLRALAGD